MNTKMQTKKAKRGFTITELVIVIAVIAILAAVLIPTFSNVISRANESAAMQEARSEYSNFSVEVATQNAEDNDFLIASGEYYFIVEDGQFNEKAFASSNVTKTGDSITKVVNGSVTYNKITKIVDKTATPIGTTENPLSVTYTYGNPSHVTIYKLAA